MSTPFSVTTARAGTVVQAQSIGTLQLSPGDEPSAIPEPELRLPLHPIVGRGLTVTRLLADIQAGLRDFVLEVLPGIGKTTVAAELVRDKAVRECFADGVLWAHLGQTPDVRGELMKWADAVGLDDAAIAKRKTDAELSRAVESRLGDRKVLVVVDDVWTSEAGQHFMLSAPGCVRVLTTRHDLVARELSPGAKVYLLEKLSSADSLTLLRALAPAADDAEHEALLKLAGMVDGMPLALVLLGKMLRNHEDDDTPVQSLLAVLRDTRRIFMEKKPLEYSDNQNFTLEEVVESGFNQLGTSGLLNAEEVDGDALRAAAVSLSVLRPDPVCFDTTLAAAVADVPPAALRQLAQAGLLERRAGGPGTEARYTMHRVIAECLRDKLPPERKLALNAKAAGYYLERLHALEENDQKRTLYLGLYRYENPQWREAQDNWLYHFAQAGYGRESRLAFLRAWFTAFWWWSCFTDAGFDFCDQLLNEWDHRLDLSGPEAGSGAPLQAVDAARMTRLREGLDLLRRFKTSYPKETQDRSAGDWAEVRDTLQELRRRSDLDTEPSPTADEPDACTVRGLTDIFLAEAARFGDHDVSAAQALYEDAFAMFNTIGDDWDAAWSLYHHADMLASAGRTAEARPLCEQALPMAEREGDPEVLSLLHRVLGDVALAEGDMPTVQRHYAVAIEWAYRFQVVPEAPDAYTVAFYPETAGEVAQRVLSLHAKQPDAALALAQALRRPWERIAALAALAVPPELSAMSADVLAATLFPSPLSEERLAAEGEAYGARVKQQLGLLAAADVAES